MRSLPRLPGARVVRSRTNDPALTLRRRHATPTLQIPLYAVFKLWSGVISPMVLGRSAATSSDAASDEPGAKETTSKRQEKLRKRSERGDPRVRMQTRN